jgi:hypothetical protein
MNYIYVLSEKNGDPFYVGRTNDMKRRLYEHKLDSKTGTEAKYQFIRDLKSKNIEWTMDLLIEIDEESKHYEDFYVYLLISEGYNLTNMRAGDSIDAGKRAAMQDMRKRGEKFATAVEFLGARDREVDEANARKKAERLNAKYRNESKNYDETKVLVAGNKPQEQFMSPWMKARIAAKKVDEDIAMNRVWEEEYYDPNSL